MTLQATITYPTFKNIKLIDSYVTSQEANYFQHVLHTRMHKFKGSELKEVRWSFFLAKWIRYYQSLGAGRPGRRVGMRLEVKTKKK